MKIYEYDFSVRPHISRISKVVSENGDYLQGVVFTEWGAVNVYTQGGGRYANSARLEYLDGSTVRVRQIRKRFTERGLVRLAKRYAKEFKG